MDVKNFNIKSLFQCTCYAALESKNLEALNLFPEDLIEKSPTRQWNILHYACQLRELQWIHYILQRSKKSHILLTGLDSSLNRPCDLLPINESPNLGQLYSWGAGPDYQLGYAKEKQINPKKLEFSPSHLPPINIVDIEAQKYHSICLTDAGNVWTFGSGRKGILGLGNEQTYVNPTLVPVTSIIQIAIGVSHTLCLNNEGDIFVWGDNKFGQLGIPGVEYIVSPTILTALKKFFIVKIKSGKNHCGAMNKNGDLYLWGDDSAYQLFLKKNGENIIQVNPLNLIQSRDDTIVDFELGEDVSCIQMSSECIARSNESGKILQLHLPGGASGTVKSLAISQHAVYVLTSFYILHWLQNSEINSRTHYKLKEFAYEIKSIFSGKIATAVDIKRNLCLLLPSGVEKCPLLRGCVKASFQQNHYFAIIGTTIPEKKPNPHTSMPSLFDIAEEKIIEILNISTAPELLLYSDIFSCSNLKLISEKFIATNLSLYLTPANIDYFLAIKPHLLEGIQQFITKGDFISIQLLDTAKSTKKKKKPKSKIRAFSGNDEIQQKIPFPQIQPQEKRKRADTDTFFKAKPLDYIPPPKSKMQPWGSIDCHKPNLEIVQHEEKVSPFKLNKWGNTQKNQADFNIIQTEEKEDQELEEVLIMIAKMESMDAVKR
ncbi:unnamed protein product [Blepharisma stoltei]|uniref:Uncharacterized protein n=1 Tax=Blepharisma stoltei TaxID=1481888 RepID=A0AAU9IX65_9CILI|nr:unnamed protein product [Blepharisma stoltei]